MNRDHADPGDPAAAPAEGGDDLPPRQKGSPRPGGQGESPLNPPGVSGGTAGTGGDNKVQDELDR